jgi:hypothetical protein
MIKNVLVIYASGEFPTRKNLIASLYSFRKYSRCRVYYHNYFFGKLPWWLRRQQFDLVIFHYTVAIPWTRHRYLKKINYFSQLDFGSAEIACMLQDEYFNTDLVCEFIRRVKVQKLYSVAPESEWPKLYSSLDLSQVRIERMLTGYVDDRDVKAFAGLQKRTSRVYDLGYRAGFSSALFSLGEFGYLKYKIAEVFLNSALTRSLRMNVSGKREQMINGEAWFRFLCQCRFILGAESGSGLWDPKGEIFEKIKAYMQAHPQASFEEVKSHCFAQQDNNLKLRALSPRHLEACMAKAGQILIEGEYSGVLQAHRHYIPLKPDFSNLAEVIERMADEKGRLEMVERAYQDIIASGQYSYLKLVSQILGEATIQEKPAFEIAGFLSYRFSFVADFSRWVSAFLFARVSHQAFWLAQKLGR